MVSSPWLRITLLLAALGWFALASSPAKGSAPPVYCQHLIAQYRLPPDTIARYAALAAGTAAYAPPRNDSMFADRAPWVGAAQRAGPGQNPYTLAFMVDGVARAAGEVDAHWQMGWRVQESPVTRREVMLLLPPVKGGSVAAGQAVTLSASSARVSFRGEYSFAPMLGLVRTRNLDIRDVRIQVWSGVAPMAWALPQPPRAALLALGATLLLWLGLRSWRAATDRPGVQGTRRWSPLHRREARPAGDQHVDAVAAAEPALPVQQARVLAALQHVLTVGLAVPTVPDPRRARKRRAAR